MQQQKFPLHPTLPPIALLNLPAPTLTPHSYTRYHQKKHMMLINGQQQFNCEQQQLSRKRPVKQQDFRSIGQCIKVCQQNVAQQERLVNITLFKICQRCKNWILYNQMNDHMTFHAAIIMENLFLGDKFSSQSRKQLIQRLHVTHVVNAATELPNSFVKEGIQYFNLQLCDILDQDVIEPCLKAAQFIQTVFSLGGKVFVHCAAGKSRSVAVILVYLIKYKAFSLNDAVAHVKSRRNIIKPNPSYMKQLQIFQTTFTTTQTTN